MPPCWSKPGPYTSACFQSIAVTFGTATSSSIDAGFTKQRLEDLSRLMLCNRLPAQPQTTDDLVVAFNIRSFQVIQQTTSLRDHFQQAAPRVIIFLVRFEMLGQFVNALAEKRHLHLGRTCVCLMRAEVGDNLLLGFFC